MDNQSYQMNQNEAMINNKSKSVVINMMDGTSINGSIDNVSKASLLQAKKDGILFINSGNHISNYRNIAVNFDNIKEIQYN